MPTEIDVDGALALLRIEACDARIRAAAAAMSKAMVAQAEARDQLARAQEHGNPHRIRDLAAGLRAHRDALTRNDSGARHQASPTK